MRALGRAAVGSTLFGIAMMSAQGVASAQVAQALNIEVRLDATAPSTGELISGVRTVEGLAKAIEGVRRIDLYVMPAGLSRDVSRAVPVDSMISDVPLAQTDFALQWDSLTNQPSLVDLVVVARSATRTGTIEIPGVRVVRAVADQVPAAPVVTKKAAPAARTATVVNAPAAVTPRAARSTTSKRVVPTSTVVHGEVSANQAQAFYTTFGQLPYAAGAASATLTRPQLVKAAAESSRGAWPYTAAGLVLMVTAAHLQHAVRIAPRRVRVL